MCRAYPTGWYVLHGAHPSQRGTVDAEDLADARQLAPCHWRTASGPQGSKRGVDRRYYDAADSYLINGTFRARATVFTRVEAHAAAVWARGGPMVAVAYVSHREGRSGQPPAGAGARAPAPGDDDDRSVVWDSDGDDGCFIAASAVPAAVAAAKPPRALLVRLGGGRAIGGGAAVAAAPADERTPPAPPDERAPGDSGRTGAAAFGAGGPVRRVPRPPRAPHVRQGCCKTARGGVPRVPRPPRAPHVRQGQGSQGRKRRHVMRLVRRATAGASSCIEASGPLGTRLATRSRGSCLNCKDLSLTRLLSGKEEEMLEEAA